MFSLRHRLKGGSKATFDYARKLKKPVLHLWPRAVPLKDEAGSQAKGEANQKLSPERELRRFIRKHRIKILNAAGPRASDEPQINAFVTVLLRKAIK